MARGDTLSKTPKVLFGSANPYMEIFNVNKDTVSNPDRIKVGEKLNLPPRHEA